MVNEDLRKMGNMVTSLRVVYYCSNNQQDEEQFNLHNKLYNRALSET